MARWKWRFSLCTKKCRCPCSREVKQWCMATCGGYINEFGRNKTLMTTQPSTPTTPNLTTTTTTYTDVYSASGFFLCCMLLIITISTLLHFVLWTRRLNRKLRLYRNAGSGGLNTSRSRSFAQAESNPLTTLQTPSGRSETCDNVKPLQETSIDYTSDYTYNAMGHTTPVGTCNRSDIETQTEMCMGSGNVVCSGEGNENIETRNVSVSIGQMCLVACPQQTNARKQLVVQNDKSHLKAPRCLGRNVHVQTGQTLPPEESCPERLTLNCGTQCSMNQTSATELYECLTNKVGKWSTDAELQECQSAVTYNDGEEEMTLLKNHMSTPEPSIDDLEERYDTTISNDSDSDAEVSGNEDIVDKIASLPDVTYAMLIAGDKVVVGVKEEAAKTHVKAYIQNETKLCSNDYSFDVQQCSKEFGVLFGCTAGDAVKTRNGSWKTAALTCFFNVEGKPYALSIGHMLNDEDEDKVYIGPVRGKHIVLGKWVAQIMSQKHCFFDALLLEVNHPGVVCHNIASAIGASRVELASNIKSLTGRPVQKFGHLSGLTRGVLTSTHYSYTVAYMEKSTDLYSSGDKLKGILLVESDDSKDFFEGGECGAPLMTMPDKTGTVFLVGVMFAEEKDRNEKQGKKKYFAYNLLELFKFIRASPLENKVAKLSNTFSTKQFYMKDIDFLQTKQYQDSGFDCGTP